MNAIYTIALLIQAIALAGPIAMAGLALINRAVNGRSAKQDLPTWEDLQEKKRKRIGVDEEALNRVLNLHLANNHLANKR